MHYLNSLYADQESNKSIVMSGLMDKVEQAAGDKLEQNAQPDNNIERAADQDVNQGW